MAPRVVVVQGSMERGSTTASLARHVGELMQAGGAEVEHVDLRERRLPFFEQSTARDVASYRELAPIIQQADGYVLSTPDYHGNPSGVLKNFMDYFWREFTGKLFGYLCVSNDRGFSAMDALRVAVRQCYGWSLPYGVCGGSGVDLDRSGKVVSDVLASRLQMMARDMCRYSALLGAERRLDVEGDHPTFLAVLRPQRAASGSQAG